MEAIKLDKLYTLKEVSDITGIHYKRIQRKARATKVKKLGKEYMVNGEWVQLYFNVGLDRNAMSVQMSTVKDTDVRTMSTSVQETKTEDINKQLLDKIENLQSIIMNHTSLFRTMATKISRFEAMELKELSTEIRETTPEPPLQVYKSVHPPNSEEIDKKSGKRFPKPSMNDINFESSYNHNWSKDKD